MVDQRASGMPLEHVLGWAEFCGLRIAVDPAVFVPRRRTEFLVREIVSVVRGDADPAGQALASSDVVVVDLCCGSGAVGAALLASLGRVELHAVDIEPAAVACARRNLAENGRVYQGDLYDPLPPALRGRVDVLAANAPYVPTAAIRTLPPEARLHESRMALDGGADGLDIQRRVAASAPDWLAPGGRLFIETSERQASQTAGIVAGIGLASTTARSEELDVDVVIGTMPTR
jgi:release factor glutamine methyltransferase